MKNSADAQAVASLEGFVQPSSYLRQRGLSRSKALAQPERQVDRNERLRLVSHLITFPDNFYTHRERAISARMPCVPDDRLSSDQRAIRHLLKIRTNYDVFPLSFRLIVLDTTLSFKKSLKIFIQNGQCFRNRASCLCKP